ncbi:universal stress protein [Tropicimonas marinistellae]|uniref:universal stress protein n=1 Tax=Tropicimonas marinistellae TaxID=1739787 RepID=UPI00082D990E|nr:universal stress protein [Tropicimonas marinistellae]
MFTRIMVPVDLTHIDRLQKALRCAADLAKLYSLPVIYVGVTTALPGKLAHTPEEYTDLLAAFSAEQGADEGIETGFHAILSHDPAVELDPALIRAAAELQADLIVMASHIPNLMDYVWPSNGGTIASHAKASVFVVRV